jgi:hypothetical protein
MGGIGTGLEYCDRVPLDDPADTQAEHCRTQILLRHGHVLLVNTADRSRQDK